MELVSTAKDQHGCALARRSVLQRVDAKPLSAFMATSPKEARRRKAGNAATGLFQHSPHEKNLA
ncbi:MAG: hypothetical protein H6750_02935 [Nitrospiraceae bacterium]|nr:hypothetical protein [Nitrospiraceae bacterium]